MEFFQLFSVPSGVSSFLTPAGVRRANDENEARWVLRGLYSKRKAKKPVEPPEPVAEVLVLNFDSIDPLNTGVFEVSEADGFTLNNIKIGVPNQPGLINLLNFAGTQRVGWKKFFTPVIFSRGAVWNLISVQYAPGNHDNSTIRFTGLDSDGDVLYQADRLMSSTSPELVSLNWNGISSVEIEYQDEGDLAVGSTGPIFHGGVGNLFYSLP